MPEKILEKKSSQDFLESDKYAALKKEVDESVVDVWLDDNEESDRDIAPVLDYFEKEAMKKGLSEVQAERLFWQTVAEKVKETCFREIYGMIQSYVKDGNYSESRMVVTDELNKLVKQLSRTLCKNLSRKSVALTVLKEKFYGLFPEVESLLEETEEEKRAKIKIPTGRVKEENKDENWEKEKGRYLVEEPEWPVPKAGELVPGLVITLYDQETQRLEKVEFLEYPHFDKDGNLLVKVKWNGEKGVVKLVDFGLVADAETGLWNARYKPQHWEVWKDKK